MSVCYCTVEKMQICLNIYLFFSLTITAVLVLTALAQKQAHEGEMAAGHTCLCSMSLLLHYGNSTSLGARLAVVMETRGQSLMTFKSQTRSDSKINFMS